MVKTRRYARSEEEKAMTTQNTVTKI